MTGDELADTLEAFARTLRLGRHRTVNGMTFPLEDDCVLLTVRSSAVQRQKRWRRKQSVTNPSRKRDGPVYGPVSKASTQASTGASRQAGGPLEVPPTPPSYSPDIPKESVVAPKDLTGLARVTPGVTTSAATESEPRDYESALREPLYARAMLVQRDPMRASLLRASEWPEVVEVARAWHEAGSRPGAPRVTRGVVDALLALWAQGFVQSDVLRVARYLPTTERFRGKVLPSCLTAEVMAIALGELEAEASSRSSGRLRAPQTSLRPVEAVPPPPEVADALDGLVRAAGGTASIAAAKRARSGGAT